MGSFIQGNSSGVPQSCSKCWYCVYDLRNHESASCSKAFEGLDISRLASCTINLEEDDQISCSPKFYIWGIWNSLPGFIVDTCQLYIWKMYLYAWGWNFQVICIWRAPLWISEYGSLTNLTWHVAPLWMDKFWAVVGQQTIIFHGRQAMRLILWF